MYLLSDLLKTKTRDEVLDELLALAVSFGLPTTAWQPGQPVRTILTLVAQKLSDLTPTIVETVKGGFGDLATLAWARLWAKSIYDVDAQLAEAATGYVTFTNASATPYPLNPGQGIVAHATTGKTYRTQGAITIPATGSIANVAIQADEVGTASDAAPGAITTMVTSLPGVTVTNPLAVLGADDETAPSLVARARSKLAALSPKGPKDAYDYVVKTLAATTVPITRGKTVADPATGIVTEYVATAAGAPSGGDVAIADATVHQWAEPWCVTSQAVGASNHSVDVTCQVWITGSNLTPTEAQTAIQLALAEFFKTVPIGGDIIPPATGPGGVIDHGVLTEVIGVAVPGIKKVALTVPAGDVALAANEVAVLGTPTISVTPF